MTSRLLRSSLRLLALVLVATGALVVPAHGQVQNPAVVIAEAYGGGGNSNAPYKNDYVVLFNRSSAPVSLSGWSIQYAAATTSGTFAQNAITPVSGQLAPGQYYLVQLAGGSTGSALPTADATGTANASGTAGKIALVNSVAGLTCNGSSAQPCSDAQKAQILDLVGYGNANFYEGAAAPTLSNTTAAIRKDGGCTDTNNNSSDFSAGAPSPKNTSAAFHPCGAVQDAAPAVISTLPAKDATGVKPNATLTVTFSEDVTVTADWLTLTCAGTTVAGDFVGGPRTFTFTPHASLGSQMSCTATVNAASVSDVDADDPPDNPVSDYRWSFTTAFELTCDAVTTPIPVIQGSGIAMAITGNVVTKGVVIGDYRASSSLRGFYLQDEKGDGNPATSDGIFVFTGDVAPSVSLGDLVYVSGFAKDYFDQSEIDATVGAVKFCGTPGHAIEITPTDVMLPVESNTDFERYEGMLVRFPQTLTVTDHYSLGLFGQVTLSFGDRLPQPTDVAAPGPDAAAQQAVNDRNRIVVDDAIQAPSVPASLFGPNGQPLSATDSLRGGDTITGLVGVMTYTYSGATAKNVSTPNAFRVRPVDAMGGHAEFVTVNPRPTAAPALPAVPGALRVASTNLLNYFNTFGGSCSYGVGGKATTCRGAVDQIAFDRQWPKTVAALQAFKADVIAFSEMENNGYGPDSAIQHLLTKLNAENSEDPSWAFIDADAVAGLNALGTDAIKNGMFYRGSRVTPVGDTAVLNSPAFVTSGEPSGGGRPSLAQAFRQNDSGSQFVVVVNHLRSKGSACKVADTGDGQGNCNEARVIAANELVQWLSTDPTRTASPYVLLVGDFNSYSMEDPIKAIKDAGYTRLVEGTSRVPSYLYGGQWGSLDHAFVSPALAQRIGAVTTFRINADEPSALQYDGSVYAPNMFAMADHNPLLVDLTLNKAPEFTFLPKAPTVTLGSAIRLDAAASDPEGKAVTIDWDLDNDGTFETVGQSATFVAPPVVGTYTVRVRATDPVGASTVVSVPVRVLFPWSGFKPPVKTDGWNTPKSGSAVPVKFSLGGDHGLGIFAVGYPVSLPVDCSTGLPSGDGEPTANPGHSGLTYDEASGQYIFVWKTQKAWVGTCRLLSVTLVDGTTHSALFKFTK